MDETNYRMGETNQGVDEAGCGTGGANHGVDEAGYGTGGANRGVDEAGCGTGGTNRGVDETDYRIEETNHILTEIEFLLWRMLSLAECAAEEDCPDSRRAALQAELEALRAQIDQAADRLPQGDV